MCDRNPLQRIIVSLSYLTRVVVLCAVAGCGQQVDTTQLSISVTSPTPDPVGLRDTRVAGIYAAAKRHDEATLLELRDADVKAQARPDPAIAFALYTVDATRYRSDFIAAYPDTEDGVNGDYGYRLVQAHLVAKGALVPIKTLGGFAAAGDAQARDRLLRALPRATGRIADAYAAEAAHDLFATSPDVALDALAALPSDIRLAATSEVGWCARRPERILAFVPTPPPAPTPSASPATATVLTSPSPLPEVLVQQQIRQSLSVCGRVAFAPPHKIKHRGTHNGRPHRRQNGHGTTAKSNRSKPATLRVGTTP